MRNEINDQMLKSYYDINNAAKKLSEEYERLTKNILAD